MGKKVTKGLGILVIPRIRSQGGIIERHTEYPNGNTLHGIGEKTREDVLDFRLEILSNSNILVKVCNGVWTCSGRTGALNYYTNRQKKKIEKHDNFNGGWGYLRSGFE